MVHNALSICYVQIAYARTDRLLIIFFLIFKCHSSIYILIADSSMTIEYNLRLPVRTFYVFAVNSSQHCPLLFLPHPYDVVFVTVFNIIVSIWLNQLQQDTQKIRRTHPTLECTHLQGFAPKPASDVHMLMQHNVLCTQQRAFNILVTTVHSSYRQ